MKIKLLTLIGLLSLRDAFCSDAKFLFSIANDPIVRRYSFHSGIISWDDHIKWYKTYLNAGEPFFIILYINKPCGYVRFRKADDDFIMIISIGIHQDFRGKYIASEAVRLACKKIKIKNSHYKIKAYIKHSNIVSRNVFIGAGFKYESEQSTNEYSVYIF